MPLIWNNGPGLLTLGLMGLGAISGINWGPYFGLDGAGNSTDQAGDISLRLRTPRRHLVIFDKQVPWWNFLRVVVLLDATGTILDADFFSKGPIIGPLWYPSITIPAADILRKMEHVKGVLMFPYEFEDYPVESILPMKNGPDHEMEFNGSEPLMDKRELSDPYFCAPTLGIMSAGEGQELPTFECITDSALGTNSWIAIIGTGFQWQTWPEVSTKLS